jgi:nitronate monooxygenase
MVCCGWLINRVNQFIAAKEAWSPEWRQKIVIETADGGPSTVK